ncbi:hypothetical protein [Winogradskyella rapida]|uniref:Uncharacterized protein n=1 Tax=Winogradskyella rapida TaxID=549701 RepID=A0ABW3KSD6_9FLAO
MRYQITIVLILVLTFQWSSAQPWMTNLDLAQDLALTQNKMVLMVWEDTTKYPYHVLVNDENGYTILIENLFENEEVSPLIWKYFVPVIVNELAYESLYLEIKEKQSQEYIDKFNDDSIKIMDVHGHILNVKHTAEGYQNITTLIQNYGINTEFFALELKEYKEKKDFYSAYYLASKYFDFSPYVKEAIRENMVDLGLLYLEEASQFIEEVTAEDKAMLSQRVALLSIQQYIILNRPRKALRLLNRLEIDEEHASNQGFLAFLYYTTHRILGNQKEVMTWKSKLSSVNLKKAQVLINLYK